jgi:hypothetical protein
MGDEATTLTRRPKAGGRGGTLKKYERWVRGRGCVRGVRKRNSTRRNGRRSCEARNHFPGFVSQYKQLFESGSFFDGKA